MEVKIVKLSDLITHQKEYIIIDDNTEYKRCRVKLHRQGIVLRDTIKGSEINTKKQQVCKTGQLLVAEIDAKVGGYGIVPEELDGAIVSSHYYLFNVNLDKISLSYLEYYLKSDDFFNQIKPQGSTNYAAIRPRDVLNINIPLPSLEAQSDITNKLQIVFDNIKLCIVKNESNEECLKELRQASLQEAIQGKLVKQDPNDEPASALLERIKAEKAQLIKEKKIKKEKPLPEITEDEILFDLPQSWEWVRLGDLLHSTDAGKSPNCKDQPANDIDEWGVIKTTAIQKNSFIEDQNKILPKDFIINESWKIREGDILITRAGPKNRVGIVCCVDRLSKNLILSDKTIRLKISEELISHKYVSLVLNSPSVRNEIETKMSGMAESQVNISQKDMRWIRIPLPPLAEQNRITKKLDQMITMCDELEKTVEHSKHVCETLMQSVIQEAFSQSEQKDNMVEFPSADINDIEDWEIAARSDGEINSVTKVKIKNRVTELLGKSRK